jgi:hypothetical protein
MTPASSLEVRVLPQKVACAYFDTFFEDDRAFVLYQKNQAIFEMILKRALSVDQVAGFRELPRAERKALGLGELREYPDSRFRVWILGAALGKQYLNRCPTYRALA